MLTRKKFDLPIKLNLVKMSFFSFSSGNTCWEREKGGEKKEGGREKEEENKDWEEREGKKGK